MIRRARARAGAALVIAAVLAACGEPASDDSADVASAGISTVSFRLWDAVAADAYRESFDAFNAIHRDIHVDVEVVPQDSYASRVASDLADGTMADIFWTTSDAVAAHAHAGDLLELDETLGENHEEWEPAVTALYTRDDELWAVPQVWDSTVVFYNVELVERAGVDPASLTWDPSVVQEEVLLPRSASAADHDAATEGATTGPADDAATEGTASGPAEDESTDTTASGPAEDESTDTTPSGPADDEPADATPSGPADDDAATEGTASGPAEGDDANGADTLRQAVRELTRDSHGNPATDDAFDAGAVVEYGINTDLTHPALWLPFLAQLGGAPAAGDDLALAGPEGQATFAYLTELPAAPPGDEPLEGRELFTTGRLALFQSTSADMRYVAEHADSDWGLAPVPAGPDGSMSVVDGIGAAANAASNDPEATSEVLRWIASADGQSALASHGVGVPAATGAQDLFLRSWSDRGVDASAALNAEEVVTAASGPRAQEVLEAVRPLLSQMFRGEVPVVKALTAAQQAADDALGS